MGRNTDGEPGLRPRSSEVMNTRTRNYSRRPGMGTEGPSSRAVTEVVGPRSPLVYQLTAAYWRELETVSNYAASATNRDGVRAPEIGRYLRDAIASALDHAQRLAIRIRQLHGPAPRADDFLVRDLRLGPPPEPQDDISVLTAMLEVQTAAIDRYWGIAAVATDSRDWITQDVAIQFVREKETHRDVLETCLNELTKSRDAA